MKQTTSVLLGLLSGPVLAALFLLIPLGVLTGLAAVVNPSLALDEFVPEEELVIPFVLIAGLISTANTRLALLMARDVPGERIFEVTTARYKGDPSAEGHMHHHPGRRFAQDLIGFLNENVAMKATCGTPTPEDYGWKFSIQREGFSPLWLAVAHLGNPDESSSEKYVLAATLEPPLFPWTRLAYKPDFALREQVEQRVAEFLRSNALSFETTREQWVDPEPTIDTSPRF